MPNTKTINQESVDKIVDAIICVGVPYMNEGWAKFPKEHTQMLDGFKATKGYKEAREQIKKLLEEAHKFAHKIDQEDEWGGSEYGIVDEVLCKDGAAVEIVE